MKEFESYLYSKFQKREYHYAKDLYQFQKHNFDEIMMPFDFISNLKLFCELENINFRAAYYHIDHPRIQIYSPVIFTNSCPTENIKYGGNAYTRTLFGTNHFLYTKKADTKPTSFFD